MTPRVTGHRSLPTLIGWGGGGGREIRNSIGPFQQQEVQPSGSAPTETKQIELCTGPGALNCSCVPGPRGMTPQHMYNTLRTRRFRHYTLFWRRSTICNTGGGGGRGGFHVLAILNLQILAQKIPCHCLQMRNKLCLVPKNWSRETVDGCCYSLVTGAAASQCVTPRGVRQFGGL